jgi:hypothetical protein
VWGAFFGGKKNLLRNRVGWSHLAGCSPLIRKPRKRGVANAGDVLDSFSLSKLRFFFLLKRNNANKQQGFRQTFPYHLVNSIWIER